MDGNELFSATTPENLGISSSTILNFIERIEKEHINLHGFLVFRNGQIAAEGYWAPYEHDNTHRIYSISKPFVTLAVGLMIDQDRLTLHDRITTCLKDKLPQDLHPYLAQTTTIDLIMMTST